MPGRQRRARQRRRLLNGEAVGHGHHGALGQHDVGGQDASRRAQSQRRSQRRPRQRAVQPVGRKRRGHPIAKPHAGHAGPNLHDFAGRVRTRHGANWRDPTLIVAANNQEVAVVEGDRSHTDAHLRRPGHRRVRVNEPEASRPWCFTDSPLLHAAHYNARAEETTFTSTLRLL